MDTFEKEWTISTVGTGFTLVHESISNDDTELFMGPIEHVSMEINEFGVPFPNWFDRIIRFGDDLDSWEKIAVFVGLAKNPKHARDTGLKGPLSHGFQCKINLKKPQNSIWILNKLKP